MSVVLYEKRDRVAYITLNRPEAMNALNAELYKGLSKAWTDFRDDPDVWVAVVTGAGEKAFCAGADLKTRIPHQPEMWEFWQTQSDPILNRNLDIWKPVIAAVNGYCLGGGMTMLLATDIRIASESATFGLPEVKRGILPGNGGTQRTLRELPYAVGMEILLYGDRITAQEAYRIGLINKVVPQAELMSTVESYARRLLENPPLAVRAIKELAIRSQGMHLVDGMRLEQAISLALHQTEDAKEGPKAFAEKRKAAFKGR